MRVLNWSEAWVERVYGMNMVILLAMLCKELEITLKKSLIIHLQAETSIFRTWRLEKAYVDEYDSTTAR